MRQLVLADVPRFAQMIEAAGVRDIVADGLARGAESGRQQRAELLRLKKALDEAKQPQERDDLTRQLLSVQRDDSALTQIGIDVALQILGAAAKRGVDGCIYRFLAPILETEPEAVAELPLQQLAAALRQIAEGNDLSDFFGLPGLIRAKQEI